MFRFLNTMRDKMFETCLSYFSQPSIVCHEVSTNIMIFKLRLHFIELKKHF
jgi:hypothetical protein